MGWDFNRCPPILTRAVCRSYAGNSSCDGVMILTVVQCPIDSISVLPMPLIIHPFCLLFFMFPEPWRGQRGRTLDKAAHLGVNTHSFEQLCYFSLNGCPRQKPTNKTKQNNSPPKKKPKKAPKQNKEN